MVYWMCQDVADIKAKLADQVRFPMYKLPQIIKERSVRPGQSRNPFWGEEVAEETAGGYPDCKLDAHEWRSSDMRPPREDEDDAESHAAWVLYAFGSTVRRARL